MATWKHKRNRHAPSTHGRETPSRARMLEGNRDLAFRCVAPTRMQGFTPPGTGGCPDGRARVRTRMRIRPKIRMGLRMRIRIRIMTRLRTKKK